MKPIDGELDWDDPVTYWEDRSSQMEGLIERLFQILNTHFPAMQSDLNELNRQWGSIRQDTFLEWKEKHELRSRRTDES